MVWEVVVSNIVTWRSRTTAIMFLLIAGLSATEISAGPFTYSSVQSPARPLNLKIVDKVAVGGSDDRSKAFLVDELPTLSRLADEGFKNELEGGDEKERSNERTNSALTQVDPSSIKLAVAYDVRAYFVMEKSSLANSLGFNTQGGGVTSGDPLLVFPNSSTNASHVTDYTKAKRETKAPLLPGDFVDLGDRAAGTSLDFFLIANGASGGKAVFSTQSSGNQDKAQHAVAFAKAGSPYLYLGFNDRESDDENFNDLLIAIDIGAENVKALMAKGGTYRARASVPAPEPAGMLLVVASCGAWFWNRRRKESTV